jgi:hypothetical protein
LIASYDGPIYHPIGEFWCKLGGTPEANAVANEKALMDIFQFLKRTD